MKKYPKLLIFAELWSIIAVVVIFFKILVISPKCFDIFDSYFTVVPLIITKIIELIQIKEIFK